MFKELKNTKIEEQKQSGIAYLKSQNQRLFQLFLKYDLELANYKNPSFSLNEPNLAKLLTDAFHFYDAKHYELHAYCVMPNHVHLLIRALKDEQDSYYRISNIVKTLKTYTAKEINKALNKTGTVWDNYYFDRIIRDVDSYHNVVKYILENPVVAGLVDNEENWRDSYSRPEWLDMGFVNTRRQ